MSMGRRIALIFKAKANKVLDKAEDPRETLDYSYEKQLELLTKVRRGVADVATSRKRLEIQVQQPQAARDQDAAAAGAQGQAADPGAAGRHCRARRPRPRGAHPPGRGQPAARRPADAA